jgi:hypothetical protein
LVPERRNGRGARMSISSARSSEWTAYGCTRRHTVANEASLWARPLSAERDRWCISYTGMLCASWQSWMSVALPRHAKTSGQLVGAEKNQAIDWQYYSCRWGDHGRWQTVGVSPARVPAVTEFPGGIVYEDYRSSGKKAMRTTGARGKQVHQVMVPEVTLYGLWELRRGFGERRGTRTACERRLDCDAQPPWPACCCSLLFSLCPGTRNVWNRLSRI